MSENTIKVSIVDGAAWVVKESYINMLINWLDSNSMRITPNNAVNNEPTNLSKFELLDMWVEELIFPGKVEDFVHIIKSFKNDSEEMKEICFYTNDHRYKIFAIDRKDDDYLGCQVTSRKLRPGEDWFRGNDLPDGPFNRKTWNNIISGIIRYELIPLSKYTKPDGVPEI